jgi:DNA-binding Xre family transcriptional regulator
MHLGGIDRDRATPAMHLGGIDRDRETPAMHLGDIKPDRATPAMHLGDINGIGDARSRGRLAGSSDKCMPSRARYRAAMTWSSTSRQDRQPEIQRGWELIGQMVKRRRTILRWSQRDLAAACGLAQSAISRLETGRLSGVRFSRFARLVAALGGLDPHAPHPAPPRRVYWD